MCRRLVVQAIAGETRRRLVDSLRPVLSVSTQQRMIPSGRRAAAGAERWRGEPSSFGHVVSEIARPRIPPAARSLARSAGRSVVVTSVRYAVEHRAPVCRVLINNNHSNTSGYPLSNVYMTLDKPRPVQFSKFLFDKWRSESAVCFPKESVVSQMNVVMLVWWICVIRTITVSSVRYKLWIFLAAECFPLKVSENNVFKYVSFNLAKHWFPRRGCRLSNSLLFP